ncbi:MAG: hypothetical protein PUB08_00885 [Firmicutes bacterium]|nr:hypothetical protein [Bacillota bacterium]
MTDNENVRVDYQVELDRMETELMAIREKLRTAEDKIQILRDENQFLKGQIEAYQYCMNCKR